MTLVRGHPWTVPAGMLPAVRASWQRFYGEAWDKYGITPAQYLDLYVAQHGCCFVCRKARGKHPLDPKGRGAQRLGVDHNHAIGDGRPDAVRALLCTLGKASCNQAIGYLSYEALGRARTVLLNAPAQTVLRAQLPADPAARGKALLTILELR